MSDHGVARREAARLMRRPSLGEILAGLGLVNLTLALVAFSTPGSTLLFAADRGPLSASLSAALDWARLATGVLGLLFTGVACLAPRWTKRPGFVRVGDVVLALLACVIGLILAEGGLRFRGSRLWGSAFRIPLSLDAMTNPSTHVPRPGVFAHKALSDFDPARERIVFFTINRFGVRGAVPRSPQSGGLRRIVCLGGSTTFGWSVTDGEDWPSQLGRVLGDSVEVVNAGRPGATTFRNFSYMRDHLLRLDPDLVILYEGFNDMWRGYRRHAGEQRDYGLVDEGLLPGVEPLDQGPPIDWPLRPLFLAWHVGQKLDHWLRPSGSHRGPEPPRGPTPFTFEPGIVAMYEHNLAAMVRLCRQNGVDTIVATFAGCDDSTLPVDEQRTRLQYVLREMPALDVASAGEALELYREATRDVARAENVPLMDLAVLMPKALDLFTDTVHFTRKGERTLAECVARSLREIDRHQGRVGPNASSEGLDAGTRLD